MKKARIALALIVVVVALIGAGFWWFVIRDDAPAPLALSDPTTQTTGAGDTEATTPVEVDGPWTVQAAEPTAAGYRIEEEFIGGAATHTAVGRTSEVSGSLTIAGTEVTEAEFTVDMTSLTYTDSPPGLNVASRARANEDAGLETNEFPEASFRLTSPIDLQRAPEPGREITAEATGDLTLHGVTKPVTFTVEAQLAGEQIEVVSADPIPIVLADYDITAPKAGPVADVADEGAFEFKLVLTKA